MFNLINSIVVFFPGVTEKLLLVGAWGFREDAFVLNTTFGWGALISPTVVRPRLLGDRSMLHVNGSARNRTNSVLRRQGLGHQAKTAHRSEWNGASDCNSSPSANTKVFTLGRLHPL